MAESEPNHTDDSKEVVMNNEDKKEETKAESLSKENSIVDARLSSRREKRLRRQRRHQRRVRRKKHQESSDLFADPVVGPILDDLDTNSVDNMPDLDFNQTIELSRSKRPQKTLVERSDGHFVKKRIKHDYYDNNEDINEHNNNDALASAMGLQMVFRRVAKLVQGILAGMALLQILFIWHVKSTLLNAVDVIRLYSSLVWPLSLLFYALTTVAVLATLDAVDPANICGSNMGNVVGNGKMGSNVSNIRIGIWGLMLNLSALVIGLINTPLDDKFALARFNSTILEEFEVVEKDVTTWTWLNIVRSIALILAWLLVALGPDLDALYSNLVLIRNRDKINSQKMHSDA